MAAAASVWIGAAAAPTWLEPEALANAGVVPDGIPGLALPALATAILGLVLMLGPAARGTEGTNARSAVRTVAVLFVIITVGSVAGAHLGAVAAAAHIQVDAGPVDTVAEVVGDPEPLRGGGRIELRLPDGHRVQARAYGQAGRSIGALTVGDLIRITGSVKPAGDHPWLRSRHLTGAATLETVEPVGRRGGVTGLLLTVANGARHRIVDGTSGMSERRRALYLGLVIGDDRQQPLGQRLRFQAAGLTHLLAVSGQNVAFAAAVARPALRLLGPRMRLACLLGVLVIFALMTRLEPSVLRATMTAAISAWAAMSGRERTGLTVLSVAVVGLIFIDPFLVDAVGFQLSVAASVGIIVLAPVLEPRLPGPAWLRSPMSITIAAQLAVTPLLSAYFGPVSVASVPANLLAGSAAAAVMTIGLTLGVVAGFVPDGIGALCQAPARLLLWWIEMVAEVFARMPAPRIGTGALMAIVTAVMAFRAATTMVQRLPPTLILAVIAALSLPRAPTGPTLCGHGLHWYPAEGSGVTVLVISGDATARGLDQCRVAGLGRIDLVVAERGTAATAELVTGADEIFDILFVAAPPQHRIVGGHRQLEPLTVEVIGGVLRIEPDRDRSRLRIDYQVGVVPRLSAAETSPTPARR